MKPPFSAKFEATTAIICFGQVSIENPNTVHILIVMDCCYREGQTPYCTENRTKTTFSYLEEACKGHAVFHNERFLSAKIVENQAVMEY
jgi:hypothetical protein